MTERSPGRGSCLVAALQVVGHLVLADVLIVVWPLTEIGVPGLLALLIGLALMVTVEVAFWLAMRRYWERRTSSR